MSGSLENSPANGEIEAHVRSRSGRVYRAKAIFHGEQLQTRWNEASYRRLSKSLLGNLPAVGRCAHFKMHSQNSRPDREQRRATAAPAASMSAAVSDEFAAESAAFNRRKTWLQLLQPVSSPASL